ncbi:MAG: carboxypeptidase regulatory-like domain-containing protein [Acidimicrobiia bacterium]|nr:carboxypeptidase regulatory-like domain-containing protein [Acidimicrobiia bacterium]
MLSMAKRVSLYLCAFSVSFAQSTFVTITGTVQDPAGAALPGAAVEAVQTQTNFKYTATTGESGDYTIANANAGTYTIRVRASGFQEYRIDNIVLAPRDVRRVDAVLRIGTVDTVIEVQGGATLIETETQRISDVRTREELRALPLTLRRAWDYFTLSPQVSKTTGGFQVRFAGSRQNQGEAVIDGTSIARSGGGFASGPLMDRTEAYQELRIDIAGANAEFGTMGQVTLTSRAGTNQFHGTFSDYYTTPAFIARNPFFSQRTGSVGHRITLGAGGPVYFPKIYNGKNKTFWFTTLEFGTGSGGITTISQSVPTLSWRRGDFSRLLPGAAVRDPFASNTPFAGNIIPASRINATARAIQDRFYATPNFGDPETFAAQNYRETRQNRVAHQPNFTLRLDHRFSDKNFIYGRITTVDWTLNNFEANPMIKERFTRSRTLRASTIAHTYSFNSSMLNEARWGISFDDLPGEPPISGKQLVSELGLRGLVDNLPDRGGLHQVGFTGIGISALNVSNVSCSPCGWDQIQQFTDNFTWFRGRHNLKFGTAWQWGRARDSPRRRPLRQHQLHEPVHEPPLRRFPPRHPHHHAARFPRRRERPPRQDLRLLRPGRMEGPPHPYRQPRPPLAGHARLDRSQWTPSRFRHRFRQHRRPQRLAQPRQPASANELRQRRRGLPGRPRLPQTRQNRLEQRRPTLRPGLAPLRQQHRLPRRLRHLL